MLLQRGGSAMQINGASVATTAESEYTLVYRHFAALIRARAVDVDLAPLQLVADALLRGRRISVESFVD